MFSIIAVREDDSTVILPTNSRRSSIGGSWFLRMESDLAGRDVGKRKIDKIPLLE
jgi:hypothetical protein